MSYDNNKSNLKVVALGTVGALIAILAFKAYERNQQIAEVNKMFTSMNINAEVNFDGTVDVGENTYKLDGLDFVNTKTGQILSIMQLGQEMINVNKKPKPIEYATEEATTEEPIKIIVDNSLSITNVKPKLKKNPTHKYPGEYEPGDKFDISNPPKNWVLDDELSARNGYYVTFSHPSGLTIEVADFFGGKDEQDGVYGGVGNITEIRSSEDNTSALYSDVKPDSDVKPANVSFQKCNNYYLQGKFQKCVDCYTILIDRNSTNPVYYENRAKAKREILDYSGAFNDEQIAKRLERH